MSTPSAAIDLTTMVLAVGRDGKAIALDSSSGPPPRIDGLTIGAAHMSRSPPHGGELHPDGDELLYLVSGEVDVILEEETGERTVTVRPGHAFIIPQGVWHRLVIREPCHLVFVTPGPGGEHRPLRRS